MATGGCQLQLVWARVDGWVRSLQNLLLIPPECDSNFEDVSSRLIPADSGSFRFRVTGALASYKHFYNVNKHVGYNTTSIVRHLLNKLI